jgi:hypothetical protein
MAIMMKFLMLILFKECGEMEDLKGFDGYFINNKGEIFNSRGWQLKPSKNQDGFLKIALRKDNKNCYSTVHHLVYKQFKGEYTGELFFVDGNKENCSIDNLISFDELIQEYNMTKNRLKRYCDLMLCSIERRLSMIKDKNTSQEVEEKYLSYCTELTNWEFENIGSIQDITGRIEAIEGSLHKLIIL